VSVSRNVRTDDKFENFQFSIAFPVMPIGLSRTTNRLSDKKTEVYFFIF
jgi:hypothetical protein